VLSQALKFLPLCPICNIIAGHLVLTLGLTSIPPLPLGYATACVYFLTLITLQSVLANYNTKLKEGKGKERKGKERGGEKKKKKKKKKKELGQI
jgi:hypothetical protein